MNSAEQSAGHVVHEDYMRLAIAAALRSPQAPFGAILVALSTGEVVAEGVNRWWENPTWHGEMDAINRCAATRPGSVWSGLRLYTTAEPCCMCQGAILWAGIPEVIFGTSIQTLIRLGWRQIDIAAEEVVRRSDVAGCRITGGVLEADCDALFEAAARRNRRGPA